MNLSGIRPSVGFYENNPIKTRPEINPIPEDQSSDNKQQRLSHGFGDEPAATVEISREGMSAVKKNVDQAVSNMEKDTTLHRYQYFVKDRPTPDTAPVRGLENFSL